MTAATSPTANPNPRTVFTCSSPTHEANEVRRVRCGHHRGAIERFEARDPEPHVHSAVYEIYHAETGECLHVGEATWLISRLNDRYNTRSGSQIKAFVENDEEIDIDASDAWERTEITYVSGVDGDQSGRKEVERALIREFEPRYNTR